MKIEFLQEPELEFGTGRHVDIRFGLMHHGPLDRLSPVSPKQVRVGVVGTPETVEGVQKWLERCKNGIAAKESNQPNLFPRFPGFGGERNLQAILVNDSQLQRTFKHKDLDTLCKSSDYNRAVSEAVQMFLIELKGMAEKGQADVFMCAVPMNLLKFMRQESVSDEDELRETEEDKKIDFHHMLKAEAMSLAKPLQIILPMTYDEKKRLGQKRRSERSRRLQDEATRAWNIYTALYYKAGGTPWRLMRDPSQLTTCYVGISFYKTLDQKKLLTSTAQVFNERGIGLILRGGSAAVSKEDMQPHLQEGDAFSLMDDVLKAYKAEHHNLPARIVVHKTSSYGVQELSGFKNAVHSNNVDSEDFISLINSSTRLLRYGAYPPLRGTFLSLSEAVHILYTKGGVDFFSTYPGLYVPRPLEFRIEEAEQTPSFLAQEILSLTKMNWNSTQFDNDDPITVRAARNVGGILKYVSKDFQARYSFYM
jgi:hypothetical protein